MAEIKLTRAQIKEKILEDTGKDVKEAVKDATKQQNLALRSMLADEQKYREANVGEKIDPIGGLIIALAANKGSPSDAAKWASRKYGEKSKIVKALNTTTDTAGGFLVPEVLSPEVIELLSATTVMRKMGCRVMQLVNGQLTIPRMTGGATAAYISEGTSITSSQETFGQINLQGHKLAAQVPISNDLLKFATANADQIVRQDLVLRMALREDLAFMEGDGTLATPVGLRNQMTAANAIAMTATPTAVTATTDAGRMINLLDNANVPDTKRGWIMRPSVKNWLSTVREATGALAFPEAQKGVFWGYPIATTTAITIDAAGPPTQSRVYLAEFPELIIGDAMTLRIDASDTAAYSDSTGAVVSSFSRDETIVRAISMHDFGMRHAGAAAALTGCTWGGA
jgi:HK97 family phage major capsid protein